MEINFQQDYNFNKLIINNHEPMNLIELVKSAYITKIIFSYLNMKKKLKIIKFNKRIQKLIDINIEDYDIISDGHCIIIDKNGKGKEYKGEGNLIFEGEYLNRKRNGFGKEYGSFKNLIFEGEYLNGKRNGFGKEYDSSNNLVFEGEYLNGKRNRQEKDIILIEKVLKI